MSGEGFFGRIARVLTGRATPEVMVPALAPSAPVLVDFEDERIPASARPRVARILASLSEVEAALAREAVPGFSAIDIELMRTSHLPSLLRSYIDIPPAHRPEIFRKTGKSASVILNESLEQMQHRIDEILLGLARQDIDNFTSNTHFIDQRYAQGNPFD